MHELRCCIVDHFHGRLFRQSRMGCNGESAETVALDVYLAGVKAASCDGLTADQALGKWIVPGSKAAGPERPHKRVFLHYDQYIYTAPLKKIPAIA